MQKFCKQRGRGGGGEDLGYLKKKEGAQLQAVSGGALEDNVKISLVILRGG